MDKKSFILIICSIILLLGGCESKKTMSIETLNGYWEIEKVIDSNGSEKHYKFNEFIDFFRIEADSSGYKTKLKPNFKGTYQGNQLKQFFKISVPFKNRLLINYKMHQNTWTETIVEMSPKRFITINNEGISYVYKRFKPIILNEKK